MYISEYQKNISYRVKSLQPSSLIQFNFIEPALWQQWEGKTTEPGSGRGFRLPPSGVATAEHDSIAVRSYRLVCHTTFTFLLCGFLESLKKKATGLILFVKTFQLSSDGLLQL